MFDNVLNMLSKSNSINFGMSTSYITIYIILFAHMHIVVNFINIEFWKKL